MKKSPRATIKAKRKISKVMREFKEGKLKSSSGDKVTDRSQAVAIALSEARTIDPSYQMKKKRKGSSMETGGKIKDFDDWYRYGTSSEKEFFWLIHEKFKEGNIRFARKLFAKLSPSQKKSFTKISAFNDSAKILSQRMGIDSMKNGGSPKDTSKIEAIEQKLNDKGVVFTFWDENGIGINTEYKDGAIEGNNYATDKGVEKLPDDIIALLDEYNSAVSEYYDKNKTAIPSNVQTLLSFADSNETLSNEKEEIYKMAVEQNWDKERLAQQFNRIFSYMAETAYNKENPETPIEMTQEERNSFADALTIVKSDEDTSLEPNIEGAKNKLKEASEKLNRAEQVSDSVEDAIEDVNEKVEGAIDDLQGNPLPFKDAGKIPNNYKGKSIGQIWDAWNLKQRAHFLRDHQFDVDIEAWSEMPYNKLINYLKPYVKGGENYFDKFTDTLAVHIVEGQYSSGGSAKKISNMTKDKKQIEEKIKKIQTALAGDKLSAKSRESMEKKLKELNDKFNRRVPVYERMMQNKGKFFIEIPSQYRTKMNVLLNGTGLKPRYMELDGKLRITVDSRPKLNRLYNIYSKMLSKKSIPVPPLQEISGKPDRVKTR